MDHSVYSLELFIAKFLRFGVLLAGALMLIGWLSSLSFSQDAFAPFQVYHEMRLAPILRSLWSEGRWGLLASYAGMFVLISLPILRVLMTLIVFVKKRDFVLAGVSGLVLLGLIVSVVLGVEI